MERNEADAPDVQSEAESESARFARSLRKRGLFGPVLLGAVALALVVAVAWAWLPPLRRASQPPIARSPGSTAEQETPEWLNEHGGERGSDDAEGGRGQRHRDEAGAMRNRFGVEGPADHEDAHLSREAARESAANAGIVGALKHAPDARGVDAPSSDPMSALGALMGDQIGSNFGFGGLGLRGLGSAYGSAEGVAGHGDKAGEGGWPHWKKSESASRPPEALTLTAASVAPQLPELMARPRRQGARHQAVARAGDPEAPAPTLPPPTNAAERLLARHSTLEGVRFIDAHGYFANTYVPGDPELRSLQARLRGYDRASLLPQSLHAARLDEGSARVAQPFDAPGQAALAVYVSASERGISSARRMLLQVGLRATPRYGGRRPTMNVAIVLDAYEPLDATAHANARALLAAFADARDPSDKLTLFAAGPGGGQLVGADAFRHGSLSVALQRLHSERSGASSSLPDALAAALQSLGGGDAANAPLGSSVAIVITPRALGAELAQLEALAHQSAVEGVPVSVFGTGPGASSGQLSRLALAGQGNLRMLMVTGDAAQAVDRELSAVARVVARAVRLRIRLAAGVQLLQVLGSQPLDEVHAERVRQAERSIDQRLRRNLGIEQDRGEDEEGVQIVIPSFYAGDAHVVLLDVVAQGPGPIADVSVRYKDLVQLGNGSARESLWLPNVELTRGPLQRNVLKNLVAHELATRLRSAGDALASRGDAALAQRELDQALALLDSLGAAVPELRGDRELEGDRALAGEYVALLAHVGQAAQRQFAADSLRFASLLKLQPRPEWDARSE